MSNPITRLYRRILTLVELGRTSAPPDESGTIATVQAIINDLVTRDRRPIVVNFGFAGCLPVGTDVVMLNIAGDPSNPVVIGSNNQKYRPKGMLPGEAMVYDAFGNSVYLKASGIIVSSPNLVTVLGKDIVVHASHSYSWDVDGWGLRWTETSPGVFKLDNWMNLPGVSSTVNHPWVAGPLPPP